MSKNVRRLEVEREREKGQGEPETVKVTVQEVRCDIEEAWVECYDFMTHGEPVVLTYCTKHEAEDHDAILRLFKKAGLEVRA